MLCYNCMREKGDAAICPFCGSGEINDPATHHLAAGTVIGGRYVLGRVLGEGGFGITYIGFDKVLDIVVAVKEYFPYGVSYRVNTTGNTVSISTGNQEEFFEKGKRRFLSEAKNVARFRKEPGIVTVTDFIEENNTAYIVMEYLDGIDLRNYLRQYGTLPVDKALDLLIPVIKSLDKMHAAGIIHRDISPDNLMVLGDGSVKLMDFGAARDYVGDERSMSVMLKKGYAPEEQYRSNGKQGPWTDVYGICATIYRCITGKTPVESLDRIFEDPLKRPSELGVSISPAVEGVLMYGLAVRREDRCQNMAELYRLLNEARAGYTVPQHPVIQPVQRQYSDNLTQAADAPVSSQPAPSQPVQPQPVQPQPYGPQNTPPSQPTIAPTGNYSYVVPNQPAQKKPFPKVPVIIGSIAAVLVIVLVVLLIVNPFSTKSTPIPVTSSTVSSTTSSISSSSSGSSSSGSSASGSSSSGSSASSKGSADSFSVSETSTAAESFSACVNYILSNIDADKYSFDVQGTDSYPLSENGLYKTDDNKDYFYTTLTYDGGLKYNCGTDLKVENKTYTINKTTLKEMMADGWEFGKYQDDLKANYSSTQLVNLSLKGKTATIFIEETGADPKDSVVYAFYLDGPAGFDSTPASFEYHGFSGEDDFKSAYQNGAPSSIDVSSSEYATTITFNYEATDSNIVFRIEFSFTPNSEKTEMKETKVAYYD